MKILMVCPYFYPEGGGLENYAYNIARGLSKKGDKITVLCATKEKESRTETINRIKIIRGKPDFIISNTPIKLNLYFTIAKLLEEEKFDLVNGHTPVPYYADMACYASRKHKVPFVLTYHNDNLHQNAIVNILCRIYNCTLNSSTLRLSTKIITPSPFCFNESVYLEKHKNKLSWIPPGVDLSRFKPKRSRYIFEKYKLPKNSRIILFVGQMAKFHKHKGVDVLIDAFSNVCKINPDIYLVLVGRGVTKEYRQQCSQHKIEKNVIFAGFVDDRLLPKYYQSADVLVLPTITQQEGFGMTLIEAMACGTPVIGTKIGGVPSVIKNKETGILVEPKYPKTLAKAIKKLLYDNELQNKLNKNSIREVNEKYNWDVLIGETEKVFKSVIWWKNEK